MSTLKNNLDLVIMANPVSPANKADLIKTIGSPPNSFFLKPLPFISEEIRGEVIPLNFLPGDILTSSGLEMAIRELMAALVYANSRKAQVIALTASTKRLGGRNGERITALYPDIILTIGDNGTAISFLRLIEHFLSSISSEDTIAVMGAGYLGELAIEHLLDSGYKNVFVLTEQRLEHFQNKIRRVKTLEELPADIKMFISCTYKHKISPEIFREKITPDAIILDVSVPPGIKQDVFEALPKSVTRLDAGDFLLEGIRYDFPPRLLCFPTKQFFYGCFAEATMLSLAMQDENITNLNFLGINEDATKLVKKYLEAEKASIPLINFFSPPPNGEINYISL